VRLEFGSNYKLEDLMHKSNCSWGNYISRIRKIRNKWYYANPREKLAYCNLTDKIKYYYDIDPKNNKYYYSIDSTGNKKYIKCLSNVLPLDWL
jgi:hypothetical protein